MKHRTRLIGGLGAGGALLVGWGVLPPRGRLGVASTRETGTRLRELPVTLPA